MSNLSIESERPMPSGRDLYIQRFGRMVKDLAFYQDGNIVDCVGNPGVLGNLPVAANDEVLFMVDQDMARIVAENSGLSFERIAARSGQNSRHQVFFGNLIGERSLGTAVKVYTEEHGGMRGAAEEVVKTASILDAGMASFEPLAVGSYAGTAYSMWKLKRDVSTLDSIDWHSFKTDPEGQQGMLQILRDTAMAAAELHSSQWGHGDLHPRNVAQNLAGSIFFIDWESASHVSDSEDTSSWYEKSYADISQIFSAMVLPAEHPFNPGIGIFEGLSAEEAWSRFHRYFFDFYTSNLRGLAGSSEIVSQLETDLKGIPHKTGLE